MVDIFVFFGKRTYSLFFSKSFNLYHATDRFSKQQIDDVFSYFSPQNRLCQLAKISLGDNLHEMPKSIFWEK